MVDALGDTGHSVFLTPPEYQASQTVTERQRRRHRRPAVHRQRPVHRDQGPARFARARAAASRPATRSPPSTASPSTGLTFDVFASKIRGTAGTKVTITVVRPGVGGADRHHHDPGRRLGAARRLGHGPGHPRRRHRPRRVLAAAPATSWPRGQVGHERRRDRASSSTCAATRAATPAEAVDVASQFISTGTVYITQDASGNSEQQPGQHEGHPHEPAAGRSRGPQLGQRVRDRGRAPSRTTAAPRSSASPRSAPGTVLQAFKLSDGSAILLGTAVLAHAQRAQDLRQGHHARPASGPCGRGRSRSIPRRSRR